MAKPLLIPKYRKKVIFATLLVGCRTTLEFSSPQPLLGLEDASDDPR
jgi:hypothetical protein